MTHIQAWMIWRAVVTIAIIVLLVVTFANLRAITARIAQVRQLAVHITSNARATADAAALAATAAALATSIAQRIAADEQATCLIQAKVLPTGHELAASLHDMHRLVLPPATAAQRRWKRDEPPALRRVIRDLAWHLAAYQRDEKKVPMSRNCG